MYCSECQKQWPNDLTACPICGKELAEEGEGVTWMRIGAIADGFSADFAREVLASYDIPAVVISKSGFFGQAGLTLNTFYRSGGNLFEVSVPADFAEEACGVLEMALGNKWIKEE